MTESWQSAWVEVLPDFSEFRKKADGQMSDILGGAGDEAGATSSRRAGSSFVGGIGKWGVGIAGAFAALGIGNLIGDAIQAGWGVLSDSVTLGSGLNESKNAIKVAYGSAFKDIAKLAKGSDVRLGLSEVDFNSIATQFSSFAGAIRSSDVAGFIDELSTRGADFASVYNLEVADALSLFQSGLAGESEPLRKYGVDLSEAGVSAFAYASGIAAAGAPLTEAQKQQARYGKLLQDTQKVQGDFGRTSGELANGQRIFQASLENAQAALGEHLLPALTNLLAIGNEKLIPMFGELVDKVGPQLADALVDVTPSLMSFVDAVVPHIPEFVSLATEALPVIVGILTLLSPLLIDGAKNWGGLFTVINDLFSFLAGDITLDEFAGDIRDLSGTWWDSLNAVGEWVNGVLSAIFDFGVGVQRGISTAVGWFGSLPGQIMASLSGVGGWLYSSGRSLIGGFLDGVRSMIGAVGNTVDGIMKHIAGFFPHSPARFGEFSGSGWNKVAESGAALAGQFLGGFETASPEIFLPAVSVGSMRPSLADVGSSSGSSFPSQLTLVVGDREFTAYVKEQAGAVVNKYDQNRSQVQTREWAGD